MKDKWMILGTEFANCPCDHGCPCQFNSPSTHGHCAAISGIQIEEGYYNDTSLDGVKFVVLFKWPGEIPDGNGTSQLIIDEGANEKQREAIDRIAHGESTEPGATHFSVFASTVTETLDTLYAPIDLDIDVARRKAHIRIEGMVESTGSSLINPFTNEEDRRGIYNPGGFEYVYAEVGSASTKASTGLDLNFKDSYGHYCVLHMNQDGVIRDQKVPV